MCNGLWDALGNEKDRMPDLSTNEDDRRPGTVVADLLDPGVADVAVGDVVVDGEAEEEDVLKKTRIEDEVDPTDNRQTQTLNHGLFERCARGQTKIVFATYGPPKVGQGAKDTHCTVRRAQIAIAGEGPLIPGRDLGIAFSAAWAAGAREGKDYSQISRGSFFRKYGYMKIFHRRYHRCIPICLRRLSRGYPPGK